MSEIIQFTESEKDVYKSSENTIFYDFDDEKQIVRIKGKSTGRELFIIEYEMVRFDIENKIKASLDNFSDINDPLINTSF